MKLLLSITALFLSTICFGQQMNKDYVLFDAITDNKLEYIEFVSDSTLLRKPYFGPNHCFIFGNNSELQDSIYKEYTYVKEKQSITIFNYRGDKNLEFEMQEETHFVNEEEQIGYALQEIFDTLPSLAFHYQDEIFWLDMPQTSNGVVVKKGKKNRKLSRILKSKNETQLEIKVHKEYQAYKQFGFEYIFGIIEITDKKPEVLHEE